MRKEDQRFFSVLILLGVMLLLLFLALKYPLAGTAAEEAGTDGETAVEEDPDMLADAYEKAEKTLTLWCADPEMEAFFQQCALDYFAQTGNAVRVEMKDGMNYAEQIYEESIAEDGALPDLYLAAGDELEELVLLGLAAEKTVDEDNPDLAETAKKAAMLRDLSYGYPLCFNTPVFVYLTEAFEEPPTSIRGMLDFIAENDLPIEVGNIVEWDADDEYFDFAFVGDCFAFSDGEKGTLDVTRDDALFDQKLAYLKELTESITIDAETVSEGAVVSHLNHSATASAIIDSDDLSRISVPYGVCPLIPLDEKLSMRGAAVTEMLCVNGFSERKDAAAAFARFAADGEQGLIHQLSPHFSVAASQNTDGDGAIAFAAYENAEPMPHSMDSDGFWKSLRNEILKLF
ncbi:MAG: extracellular solute-binding protein [Lachnospiraceae bacterium]|nr:extracellular solute-binding protein [Lachnospiraceae bacterium]